MIEFPITAFRNKVCCPWSDKHWHAVAARGHSLTPPPNAACVVQKEQSMLSFSILLMATSELVPWDYFLTCIVAHPFKLRVCFVCFFLFSLSSLFFWPFEIKVIHLPSFSRFFSLLLSFVEFSFHGFRWYIHPIDWYCHSFRNISYSETAFPSIDKPHVQKYSGCKGVMHKAHKKRKW